MPRRITEYDKERFTCGDCLILAEELSRVTGYPVTTLRSDWADGPTMHAFVLVGRRALDVNGLTPVKDMVAAWEATGYGAGGWEGYPAQFRGSHRRAREIAPLLAALIRRKKGVPVNGRQ